MPSWSFIRRLVGPFEYATLLRPDVRPAGPDHAFLGALLVCRLLCGRDDRLGWLSMVPHARVSSRKFRTCSGLDPLRKQLEASGTFPLRAFLHHVQGLAHFMARARVLPSEETV